MERKLRECETEKNRVEKELKETKQLNNKSNKTLNDLRLDVNVMLRNILNEVSSFIHSFKLAWASFVTVI